MSLVKIKPDKACIIFDQYYLYSIIEFFVHLLKGGISCPSNW